MHIGTQEKMAVPEKSVLFDLDGSIPEISNTSEHNHFPFKSGFFNAVSTGNLNLFDFLD